VRGLNDTQPALSAIAGALQQIGPDAVHINLPTRPPVETWVEPPDEEGVMRAVATLGAMAQVVHPAEGTFDLSGCQDLSAALVAILTRHPMREEELLRTLDHWAPGRVTEALAELVADGRAQVVERYGSRFWNAGAARFPDEEQSRRTAPGDLA
jgi:wyosine [tRNA(Phe)-imidazoG37] synthetase (radical SAM superfamily)